jgi:WD40 repeat protein
VPDTRFNFKTLSLFRFLASLLIFALASPLGYAQQPQTPQQRILTQEDTKTNADKPAPSGPRAARPELVLQTGVTFPAYNAVFSPDGQLLASMDFLAGSIKLWEVASWRELIAVNLGARAAATHASTSAFAFSSDSSSLFSVSAGTLKQWDTRTGRQIRSADLNQGKDFGIVVFSADARLLATTTETRSTLSLWDVGSGRKLHEVKSDDENGERLVAFALSPDGKTLATNIKSNRSDAPSDTLTLRDAASGRVIQTIKIPEQKQKAPMAKVSAYTAPVRAIRFSPDGRAVAVAFHDTSREYSLLGGQDRITGRANIIRVWDVSGGHELTSLDEHSRFRRRRPAMRPRER